MLQSVFLAVTAFSYPHAKDILDMPAFKKLTVWIVIYMLSKLRAKYSYVKTTSALIEYR